MTRIYLPSSFLKWAIREKGPRWFEDKAIIRTYGKAQLMKLYPQFFTNQEEKTKTTENLKYTTLFDDYFTLEVPVVCSKPFQIVKNIFRLDYSFDSSKVKLNTDRLLAEVNGIFNSENSRNDRTFQHVLDNVIMGHKLEQYLIDNNLFIDDTRTFLDVISPEGFTVDCKVVSSWHSGTAKYLVEKILDREKKFKNSPKTNFVVIYQKIDNIYEYRETIEIF